LPESPACCSDLRFTSSILFPDEFGPWPEGIVDAAKGWASEVGSNIGLSCLITGSPAGGEGPLDIFGDGEALPGGENENLVVPAGLKSVAFLGDLGEVLASVFCRDLASSLSLANIFCCSLAGADLALSLSDFGKMLSFFCSGACGFCPDPNGEKDFLDAAPPDDDSAPSCGGIEPKAAGELNDVVAAGCSGGENGPVPDGESGFGGCFAPAEKGDHELWPNFDSSCFEPNGEVEGDAGSPLKLFPKGDSFEFSETDDGELLKLFPKEDSFDLS